VTLLGGQDARNPVASLPVAKVLTWAPISDTEGAATARVIGIGVQKNWPNETTIGTCDGIIAFKYKSMRVDNGRAAFRETLFTESPVVVKPRQ